MKGVSIWLFSKVVMLVFLVSVFAITTGMIAIVSERAFADSAEALTMQIKDGMQGVVSTGSLSSQKAIPIPERIPEGSDARREYVVEVGKKMYNSNNLIYAAVSWDTKSQTPVSFAASSLLYYPSGITVDGGATNPPSSVNSRLTSSPYLFNFKSSEYRYLVITKSTSGSFVNVCIKACNTTTVRGFEGCSTEVC